MGWHSFQAAAESKPQHTNKTANVLLRIALRPPPGSIHYNTIGPAEKMRSRRGLRAIWKWKQSKIKAARARRADTQPARIGHKPPHSVVDVARQFRHKPRS